MEPTPPMQPPVNPSERTQKPAIDPELPILVRPVPRPEWPKAISAVRVLTGVQVALVMITGNCSFGIPLVAVIGWPIERFNWHEDSSIGPARRIGGRGPRSSSELRCSSASPP